MRSLTFRTFFYIFAFVSRVLAGKFSKPLVKKAATPSEILHLSTYDHTQKMLGGEDAVRKSSLEHQAYFIHTTNFSLGTPRQHFSAVVDLSWTELFVPSSTCIGKACPDSPRYDSSTSSTYHANGTQRHTSYGYLMADGKESVDTLTVTDGLQVRDQHFSELTYYERSFPAGSADYFNSVLGLAVENPLFEYGRNELSNLSSPFRTMIDAGMLDQNMFSLKLAQNNTDGGSITFGGCDDTLFEGELISHPWYQPETKFWNVEASSLSMSITDSSGNPQVHVNESLSGTRAILSTTFHPLAFTEPLFSQILVSMNITHGTCALRVVDCDNIDSLPTMTIGIGDQKIEIVPNDYVTKAQMPWCRDPDLVECVPMIELMLDSFPGGVEDKRILLGSLFLEKVYSVFDWDEKTISFGRLRT